MTKIIIENSKCQIQNLNDEIIIKELDLDLSYMVQGFGFMSIKNNWDGRNRLLNKNGFFPIGLLSRVERIFRKYSHPYEKIDKRKRLKYQNKMQINPKSGFEHRDYQKEMIEAAWKHKSGTVRAATGRR